MSREHRSGARLDGEHAVSHSPPGAFRVSVCSLAVRLGRGVVLAAIAVATAATGDEPLTLPLAEADTWARVERAIAHENAGLWGDAIDQYLAMIADVRAAGGEKQYLLLDPPDDLARKMAGCLRLIADLTAAKIDVVLPPRGDSDAELAAQDKIAAENEDAHRRFLVLCGIDPAGPEIAAAAKRHVANTPGLTEADGKGLAIFDRATALLHERYGQDARATLLFACDLVRTHAASGKIGVLLALHRSSVHVGVETYVARRLGDLPEAGRTAYHERMGAPARAKLMAAGDDRRRLRELVRDHRALPETALALDRLALLDLAAGDAVGAIDHWKRVELETRHQDAISPAAMLARRALAHAELGEVEAAEILQSVAAAQGLAAAAVRLGGVDRPLADHLAACVVLARDRAARRLPEFTAPGRQAWKLDYRREFSSRVRAGEPYPVEYLPIVDEAKGLVYLRTHDLIRAYELASGDFRAEARPKLVQAERPQRTMPRAGDGAVASEGFHALCVGGRYLCAMTDLRIGEDEDTATALPTASLLCYDRELALSWRRPNPDGDEDALLARALIGSVLASDGETVYAGVTVFSGDITSHVYAFDLVTGRTRWHRYLCGRPQVSMTRYPSASVACAGSTVYVATGMGCAAALDAATGEVRWLSHYRALPEEGRATRATKVHENRWWLQAPFVFGGRVAIAPTDGPDVFLLSSATGREIQHYPGAENRFLRYCVGLDQDGALVLGGRQVHRLCERGVPVAGSPLGSRQPGVATMIYDEHDREDQLSRWDVEGTTHETLYASVTHDRDHNRTLVSLYRSDDADPTTRVAAGTLEGRKGVVLLGPPTEAKNEAQPPIRGQVTVDFKRTRDKGDLIHVIVPADFVARPALARGQVLVPTAAGVMRLATNLDAKGFWSKQVLDDYTLGNLCLTRSSSGTLLLVAGRERCVAYRERSP